MGLSSGDVVGRAAEHYLSGDACHALWQVRCCVGSRHRRLDPTKGNTLLLAAEFGTGQVFWSILWFFLFFVWIMMIFSIFGDIIRSDDMGGVAKAVWSIFIIFLPFLGIFAYLIIRGGKMGERQMKAAKAQEAAMQDYIRTTAGGASAADELAKLADLHSAGKLDDAEYAAAKAKVVS
jgi:hypothetical protein